MSHAHSSRRGAIKALILIASGTLPGTAQDNTPHVTASPQAANEQSLHVVKIASPSLALVARAMGERLRDPDKARMVMRGTLSQNGRTVLTDILWQSPGKLAISVGGSSPSALQFDPIQPASSNSRSPAEDQVFESLYADLPETFLADVGEGATYRYLGGRFRLDDGSDSGYSGPYLDVYQVLPHTGKRLGAANNEYARFYRFSSETMLAHSVTYVRGSESNPTQVETRFLGWHLSAGEMVPKEIVRLENGKEALRFTLESAVFLPAIQ